MKKIFKILLGILSAIIILVGVALFYLFYDPSTESISTEGLIKVSSNEIEKIDINQTSCSDQVDTISISKNNIIADESWFKDETGRTMFLRGINLGGSSKVPYTPYMATHVKEGFLDNKTISFIGRPFPLDQADEHFNRLSKWGFHFIRFIVTWEAIEHEGPGIYDEAYLDYIVKIIKKADEYNLNVFIDPHQDVWSRYSGGDGAPLWTFEAAGMDVTKFQDAGAALIHNLHGDPFPKMIWPTNNFKLAAASMFTLFFGGNQFAPQLKVQDTIQIQDYLQNHFIDAMKQVAIKLKDQPNVVGFEFLNEPSAGFIGVKNLNGPLSVYYVGNAPTGGQAMFLGDGITTEVKTYQFGGFGMKEGDPNVLNPDGISIWKSSEGCIWKQNGVWALDDEGIPKVLKSDYFTQVDGRPIDFPSDYLKPVIDRYAEAIRSINSNWLIFIEPVLFPEHLPLPVWTGERASWFVNSSHWYDGITLGTKRFTPWLGIDYETGEMSYGKRNVKQLFQNMFASIKLRTKESLGEAPTLIGETGIPYDLNDMEAYTTGDFEIQDKAFDRIFNAMEKNLLNYTIWNYTADNSNERGDQWNGEDLSIFSPDQQNDPSDINSGGRALDAVIRPYPYKVAGKILEYSFFREEKEFVLKFEVDKNINKPTEIFIPDFHYGNGYLVWTTGGKLIEDEKNDLLLFYPANDEKEQIVIVKGLEEQIE